MAPAPASKTPPSDQRNWFLRHLAGARNASLEPRDRGILRVLVILTFWNGLVAVSKLVVGVLSGRLTIVADGFHSLLDTLNNVIGFFAILIAASPPDREHPYGHRKFENVAAMLIGGAIVLIGWEVLKTAAVSLWTGFTGEPPPATSFGGLDWIFAVVILGSLGINIGVSLYERRRGKALQSPLLIADAHHTLSDCAVTVLSLASLLLGGAIWWLDPVLALGVLGFLGRAAWEILSENLPAFTDRARLDPADVARVAESVTGVHGTYGVRSHGTSTDIHLDLSIVIDKDITAEQAETVERSVKQALRGAFPSLTLIGLHHRTEEKERPPAS